MNMFAHILIFVSFLSRFIVTLCPSFLQSEILLLSLDSPKLIQNQTLDPEVLEGQQNFGFGLWFKWQALSLLEEIKNSEDCQTSKFFIFSMCNKNSGKQVVLLYMEIQELNGYQQTFGLMSNYFQNSDVFYNYDLYFDGHWILFYIYFDFIGDNKTKLYFYYPNQEITNQYEISELPQLDAKISYIIGGIQENIIFSSQINCFSQYKGRISSIVSEGAINIMEDLQYSLKDCDLNLCKIYSLQLNKFDENYNIQTQTEVMDINAYVLRGWIKMLFEQQFDSVYTVFRITNNIDENFQDKFSAISLKYYLSEFFSNNWYQININYYVYPSGLKDDQYVLQYGGTDTADFDWQVGFKVWHYFQFVAGLDSQSGSIKFKFPDIFGSEGPTQQQEFDLSGQYTGVILYIFLGGDKYGSNKFQGQFSNITFTTLCKTSQENNYPPFCHYSCDQCTGPFKTNCKTCPENSFRNLYQYMCICENSYSDIDGDPICKSIVEMFPSIQVIEHEIVCNQEGFDSCSLDGIQCSFGYFNFKDICLRCPNFQEQNQQIQIECADCVLNPKQFQYSLKCSWDLLSFDDNPDLVYQQISREKQNTEYFNIVQISDVLYELQSQTGRSSDQECQPGFYQNNKNCIFCGNFCQVCQTAQTCKICIEGYVINNQQQCQKCYKCKICQVSKLNEISCISCNQGYFLNNINQCQKCGINCASCRENALCNYCKDQPKYFISIDGVNCQTCENFLGCQHCFQIMQNDTSLITTFDIYEKPFKFDNNNFNNEVRCAKCKPLNILNFETNLCTDWEEFMYDSLCEFTVSADEPYCISANYVSKDCFDFNFCSICIQNFCIKCDDGYYSDVLTGECNKCQSSCQTCVQQNKIFKDSWKWNIRPFYNFLMEQLGTDHPFEKFSQTNHRRDLETICSSCNTGYTLVDSECIQDCPTNCPKCVVVEKKIICIQCPSVQNYGFLRSQSEQYQCLECPNYCAACFDRKLSDIQLINHFFEINYDNIQFSRICYQKFQHLPQSVAIYLNQELQTTVVCNKYLKCLNEINLSFELFCSQSDFEEHQTNDQKYSQYQYFIDDFFLNGNFLQLEIQELIIYLNKKTVTKINYILQFKQGSAPICKLPNNIIIQSSLRKQVFAIQELNLKLVGLNDQASLSIPKLIIKGFILIEFSKLKIINAIINLENYLISTLIFLNCIFNKIGDSQSKFYFYSNDSVNLNIHNLIIQDAIFNKSTIFDLYLKQNKIQQNIKVTNLIIINSQLIDTSVFSIIQSQQLDEKIIVNLENIQIQNSIFRSSNFFSSKNQQQSFIGYYNIQQLKIFQSNFTGSTVFYLPNIKTLTFNDVIIQNANYYNKSIILLANQFTFQQAKFVSLQIFDSHIFSNQIYDLFSQNDIVNLNINLLNLGFNQIIYNLFQAIVQFFKFQNYFLNLQVQDLKLIGLVYELENYEFIPCTYSIFEFNCYNCQLQNINHNQFKKFDYIKFLILARLDDKQKIFHSSLNCMKKFVKENLVYFLYISQYQNLTINNLRIHESVIFNYPFVLIQGSDVMIEQIMETINIFNSQFQNNIEIVSKTNSVSAMIFISTNQNCTVCFKNNSFENNHLNQYTQDLTQHSSTTILIDLQLGNLLIEDSIFKQNLITNSTDSILYVKAVSVRIVNTLFQQCNILNYLQIIDKMLFEKDQQSISDQAIQILFPIQSLGGCGYFLTKSIDINYLTINQSYGLSGGSFYFDIYDNSKIKISNSLILNTMTSLNGSFSSYGGFLYINAKQSSLQFSLINSKINSSLSRTGGGSIYIQPSLTYNKILLKNLTITNTFAIRISFLSFGQDLQSYVHSIVNIYNLSFQQTITGYYKFLSQLDNLQEIEQQTLQNNNPLVYLKYSYIKLSEIKVFNSHNIFLFQLVSVYQVSISGINILESIFYKSPLIQISLKSNVQGKIMISNLFIQTISKLELENLELNCSKLIQNFDLNTNCRNINFDENKQVIIQNQIEKQQRELQNCNILQVFNDTNLNFSLIELLQIENTHLVRIENFQASYVNCTECQSGLFYIYVKENQEQNNIHIIDFSVKNSYCGQKGCLTILTSDDQQYFNELVTINRFLQQFDYDMISSKLNYQVLIANSYFIENIGTFGGAICIVGIDSLIFKSSFLNNSAIIGGAIYFIPNQFNILILQSLILYNSAKIGGGIFLKDSILQQTNQLELIVEENAASIQSDDVSDKPRSLTLSIDGGITLLNKTFVINNDNQVIEKIVIKPYHTYQNQEHFILTLPSGISIGKYSYFDVSTQSNRPYQFKLRIVALGKLETIQHQLSGTVCTLTQKIFNITSNEEITNLSSKLSYQNILFNTTTGDYNLDDLIIQFNPQYSKDLILRIFISCNCVSIPLYNVDQPYMLKKILNNYTLYFDIQTFPCQLGEYLNQITGACIICDYTQNQYQVKLNSDTCQFKDETKIKTITSSTLELREGYWRAYYYSTKIENCIHLEENCLGGWKPGDQSCAFGHIGALCEQCDLYNINGDGSFSRSSDYKCGSCDQTQGNIISIFFVSLWTFISIVMSVNSTILTIKQLNTQSKLKAFRILSIIRNPSTAVLIKVFTNYLQIISTISKFQLKIPEGIIQFFNSAGNPIDQMAYSLDCFLVQISQIKIIYMRTIWSLIMTISYIILFFIVSGTGLLFKYYKFNISILTTPLIYIFIYFSPNQISQLISLLSSRNISEVSWIQGNVSYRFNTQEHLIWMFSACFPVLLLLSILIPFLMLLGLIKNRKKLDQSQTRNIWGYLYNEYTLHAYYWEFVKLFLKEVIIISLAYYEDYIAIKASLVFLFIFAYSYLTTSSSPYTTGELNKLDIQSTTICAISIILGSSIFAAQSQNILEIVWPFYIVIGVLNVFFFFRMVIKIIFAYFDKLYEDIDRFKIIVRQQFPNYINQHPCLIKILTTKSEKNVTIEKRFKKLKFYLLSQAKRNLQLKSGIAEIKFFVGNNFSSTQGLLVEHQTRLLDTDQDMGKALKPSSSPFGNEVHQKQL